MVKEPKKRGKMPAINADGRPRGKPGKKARPGEVRDARLIMRLHADLLEILTERAREKGLTRSQYVEQILVGWCRLDPRNGRIDMIGKFIEGDDQRGMTPFGFYDRWRQFATASRLVLGSAPPADWYPSEMDVPSDHDPDEPALPPRRR